MPPRLAVVFGTRPEAIKLAPVVEELRRRGVDPTIISTGQHTSLLRGTPAETVLKPTIDLELASNNDPLQWVAWMGVPGICAALEDQRPNVIIVVGDTASAFAGAATGEKMGIPVAHVEAGVRSHDLTDPWPEERFRVRIDEIAERLFCATEANREHLCRERAQQIGTHEPGHDPRGAHLPDYPVVTGNPGIDALYAHTQPTTEVADRVMVTLHRRESFGTPLYDLTRGIWKGAQEHPRIEFIWPVHPNPEISKVLDGFYGLPQPGNLQKWHPMGAYTFAHQLSTSRAVITDSGGVQEEAAALGIPCVVAREKTDRPESVEAGLAKVVGRTEQGILDGLDWALSFTKRPDPSHCFGDGHASPRVVDHLLG